ncbi:MAG: GEVED domain-containing protein, partial [Bacteroidia bacterium]
MSVNAVEILDGSTVVYSKGHAGSPYYGCEAATGQYTLISSSPSFTLKSGKTYSFGFTTGISYPVGVGVWIDLNADNDFADAGEYISTGWACSSGNLQPSVSTLTYFTSTIPAGCAPGTTRMRIRTTYSACTANDNGCTVYNYGEAEDYTINLTSNTDDVGISALISPTNLCGATADPFIVQVKNYGNNTVSAGIPVSIKLSGVASGTYTKTLTRSLATCATDTIHLTTLNTAVLKGVLSMKSYTSLTADIYPTNDTNYTNLTLYGSQTPYSGTHAVGPTGKFPSIKSAMDSLAISGVNGNVILELQSTYSSSAETFPVTIPKFLTNICGVTNSNPTVTIRPSSGATNLVVAGNNSTALFILDNAYRVTFDGRPGGSGTSRQLSFSNTSTTGTVFTLINDAIRNSIRYCNIRSANSNSASGAIFLGTSNKLWGNDSNVIANNFFSKSAPTSTLGSAITSSPTSNLLVQTDNITIDNNEFMAFFNFGINVVNSLGNGEKWTITNNSFYDTNTVAGSTSTSWTAINFVPGTTSNSVSNIISGNFIGGTAANCGGSPFINSSTSATMGGIRIQCNPGPITLVQSNVIQNFSLTNTANTAQFMGINPSGGSMWIGGAPGKGNTIGHAFTPNSISTLGNNAIIAISSSSANDMVFSYNTIANITQNNTGASGGIRCIVNTGGTSIYITNNIIKSISTNCTNTGGITTGANAITGIFSSAATQNQYITDNLIGNGPSEGLSSNYNSTAPSSYTVVGIATTSGISQVKRNKINGLTNTAPNSSNTTSSAIVGIYNSGTAGGVIDNNEIRNLNATSTTVSANQVNGMYVSSSCDITNNIISGLTSNGNLTGNGQTAVITGISFQTALPTTIKNNTIENFNATAALTTEVVGITTASTLTYIQNNTIRHLASNSTSATLGLASVVGIAITPSTVNKIVTGNKIYGLFNYNTTSAATISGIYMTNT